MLLPEARGLLTLLLIVAALLAAGCGNPDEGGEEAVGAGPPVLLVTIDGIADERLAVFGGKRAAPTIERLVQSGTTWLRRCGRRRRCSRSPSRWCTIRRATCST